MNCISKIIYALITIALLVQVAFAEPFFIPELNLTLNIDNAIINTDPNYLKTFGTSVYAFISKQDTPTQCLLMNVYSDNSFLVQEDLSDSISRLNKKWGFSGNYSALLQTDTFSSIVIEGHDRFGYLLTYFFYDGINSITMTARNSDGSRLTSAQIDDSNQMIQKIQFHNLQSSYEEAVEPLPESNEELSVPSIESGEETVELFPEFQEESIETATESYQKSPEEMPPSISKAPTKEFSDSGLELLLKNGIAGLELLLKNGIAEFQKNQEQPPQDNPSKSSTTDRSGEYLGAFLIVCAPLCFFYIIAKLTHSVAQTETTSSPTVTRTAPASEKISSPQNHVPPVIPRTPLLSNPSNQPKTVSAPSVAHTVPASENASSSQNHVPPAASRTPLLSYPPAQTKTLSAPVATHTPTPAPANSETPASPQANTQEKKIEDTSNKAPKVSSHQTELPSFKTSAPVTLSDRGRTARQTGLDYELYIGRIFENAGWAVEYNGLAKGGKDSGIDLICKKNHKIYLVQCKCYNKNKRIYEKTIHQLFGSVSHYRSINKLNSGEKTVYGVLVTSSSLTSDAKDAVRSLDNMLYREHIEFNCPPEIKCYVTHIGQKFYYLSSNPAYQFVKHPVRWAFTAEEAEKEGFRPPDT